jgi:GTP 3',8-cyclase
LETVTAARPLVDSYGRVHRDLRISVTDRCNFRCTYCMPAEGMRWLPREEILSFEEIERVARVLVQAFAFDGIRLTGGEPTMRAHLPVLVSKLAALGVDVAMTTNGATLPGLADELRGAGLGRINVSCDSLRRERFAEMTRRDELPRVLAGIDAAVAAGFDPVKVNVVLVKGVNDDEIVDFAAFGRTRGVEIRFIELMPLDADHAWSGDRVVRADDVVAAIDAVFPVEPVVRGSEPAELFGYRDGAGRVGVIASVTRPFCGSCDRVRLTAEGALRTCLFAHEELDLRALLRGGASDDDLAAAVEGAIRGKGPGHAIGSETFVQPRRTMSRIGG